MSLLGYPSVFRFLYDSFLSRLFRNILIKSTVQLSLIGTVQKKSVLNKSKYFLKKQNFKNWLSITIFGHFAKYIVRQNGYKMVDFGNEVLINQLDG